MNHTTLGIVAIVAAAVLAAGILTLSAQQAAFASGKYRGGSSGGDSSETEFKFQQKQKNDCSGYANCENEATLTFDPEVNNSE